MAILDQIDYASVRRAIDVTLDDGIDDDHDDDRFLPDRVIADPIYGESVDAEIYAAIPPANPWPGTLTPAFQVSVKRAAIFLTAARIYPAMPVITQEQIGEHRWRREYESVQDVVNRLRGDAYDVIGELILALNLAPTASIDATRFRRAPAYRGR